MKLEEQLRTVDETLREKRKQVQELQQDLQVSPTTGDFKGPVCEI